MDLPYSYNLNENVSNYFKKNLKIAGLNFLTLLCSFVGQLYAHKQFTIFIPPFSLLLFRTEIQHFF